MVGKLLSVLVAHRAGVVDVKKYVVDLSAEEREQLEAITAKGMSKARRLRRAPHTPACRRRASRQGDSPGDERCGDHCGKDAQTLRGGRFGGGTFGEIEARRPAQARRTPRSVLGGSGLQRPTRGQEALEYAAPGRPAGGDRDGRADKR